jgi:hypothetical protein
MDVLTPSAADRRGADPRSWRPFAVAVGWVAVVLPFVSEILTIVRADQAWLVQRLPDDAFYYLEVGERLGRGEGFTFDGIHETNGFHVLWQLLLVPISWVAPDGPAYVKAVLVVGVVLSLAALLLVVRVVARAAGIGAALFGAFVVVHAGSIAAWTNGMEGPAVVLTLALVLTALDLWARDPDGLHAVFVGVASATTVLARFDLAAVVWVVPVAMALRARSARPVVRWAVGAAAIGLPIGAWWLARWRHVLTTSATVKEAALGDYIDSRFGGRVSTGYARYLWDTAFDYAVARFRSLQPGEGLPRVVRWGILGVAFVGAMGAWGDRKRGPLSPTTWAITTVAVVVALKAVVDVVAAPLWANAWYAAPQQLAFPLAIGVFAWLALRRCAAWSVPVAFALAAILILVLLPPNLLAFTRSADRHYIDGRWQDELAGAAAWVRTQGPDGRYGAFDAGLLGFELDGAHELVNLDGLVNNYDVAELVADRAPSVELVRYNEVDYVVNRLTDERRAAQFACATPIWQSPRPVPYGDASQGSVSEAYLWVLDVRACRE